MDQPTTVAPAAPAAPATANDAPIPASGGSGQPPGGDAQPSSEPPREPITKHSRIQARIDDITRQRYEAERRAEAAEARLAEQERQRAQTQQFSEIDTARPRIDQFNSLEEYQLAMADWTTKRTAAMVNAEWEKRMQQHNTQAQQEYARQEQARIRQEQVNVAIQERLDVGRKTYPDFQQAIDNPELPPIMQHPMLLGALMSCKNAHHITYALAKNPAEYERLYAMRNPWEIARELNTLDSKFSGSGATTQAPPPPPNRNGVAVGQKEWNDMSTKEHAERYWARKR